MLQQKQRTMLTKQILLFSSNHDGEVLAAVAAANRTLAKANADWHDVIEAFDKGSNGEHYDGAGCYAAGFQAGCNQKNQPDHHEMLSQLKRKEHVLNEWSAQFVNNLYNHKDWRLTEKQCACIERMYRQFCGK